MRREPLKYSFVFVVAFLVIIEVLLLVSGKRVLLSEKYLPEQEEASGASFYVPAEEARFACTYFTGRKRVYETLSSNQYDECPFIWIEG